MKMFADTGMLPSKDCDKGNMPVPASRMMSSPASLLTSMQVVLPPCRTECGPGEAIEPRTPQKRTFIRATSSFTTDFGKAFGFSHKTAQISQRFDHGVKVG